MNNNITDKIKEVKAAFETHLEQYDIDSHVIICNNSGGKDSGAVDLLAREIFGDNGYRSIAADTGNEHPLTIEHLKTLHEQRGGNPVEIIQAIYTEEMFSKRKDRVLKDWRSKQVVKAGAYRGIVMPSLVDPNTKFADAWRKQAKINFGINFNAPIDAFTHAFHKSGNPFLDMALLHGGFPLGRQRFCTQELKIDAVFQQVVSPLLDAGETVIQWSGVRADESEKRAGYDRFSVDNRDSVGDLYNFLPIHQWTAQDVFEIYKYFGVKPNPLYTQGMGRVGCMPCILVSKEELSEIAARFPDEIGRVARWEKQVAMVSRWVHWMMVGHVDRRQFKPVHYEKWIESDSIDVECDGAAFCSEIPISNLIDIGKDYPCKLGVNARLPNSFYTLDVDRYTGTSMLGPRGGVGTYSVHDAVEWAKTGRGGKVYDLVKASLDVDVCSSKYGLCE